MKKILASLSVRQKITIAVVGLLISAGIYSLVHWQKEGSFRPLFTGLAPEDASGIVQKLKEAGVEYRLPENGGAVLVPASRLADLRLTMAAAGLPKTRSFFPDVVAGRRITPSFVERFVVLLELDRAEAILDPQRFVEYCVRRADSLATTEAAIAARAKIRLDGVPGVHRHAGSVRQHQQAGGREIEQGRGPIRGGDPACRARGIDDKPGTRGRRDLPFTAADGGAGRGAGTQVQHLQRRIRHVVEVIVVEPAQEARSRDRSDGASRDRDDLKIRVRLRGQESRRRIERHIAADVRGAGKYAARREIDSKRAVLEERWMRRHICIVMLR